MATRVLSDEQWLKVDAAIKAGELSLRLIAQEAGVSEGALRKRIKARGLVRDLGKRVAQRTTQKLIAATAEGLARRQVVAEASTVFKKRRKADPTLEEAEELAIEVTAEALAVIIGRQRHESHRAKALVDRLIGDLTAAAMHRETLEGLIGDETQEVDEDGKPVRINASRRNAMIAAVSLPQQAKAAAQLVNALRTVQEIERRAWGIADDTPPPTPAGESPELVQGIRSLALSWKDRHKTTPPA